MLIGVQNTWDRGEDRGARTSRSRDLGEGIIPAAPSALLAGSAGSRPQAPVSPGPCRGITGLMSTATDLTGKRGPAGIAPPGLDARPRDAFTLGVPTRIPFQIQEILRTATMGLFDGRDPSCSIPSTLTKIGGVVLGVTAVTLGVMGVTGALLLWAFHAAFG